MGERMPVFVPLRPACAWNAQDVADRAELVQRLRALAEEFESIERDEAHWNAMHPDDPINVLGNDCREWVAAFRCFESEEARGA